MQIGINLSITGTIVLNPPAVEEPGVTLGPDVSTFAGGGNWSTGGGWTEFSPTELRCSAGGTTVNTAVLPDAVIPGAVYQVSWDLLSYGSSGFSNGAQASIGGASGQTYTTPGTYVEEITAVNNSRPAFICDEEEGCSVGNWSFREILNP